MTEIETDELKTLVRPRSYFVWGWIGTAAWASFVAGYFNFDFTKILCLAPNLFGDFMAGTFAPLAFLWLIVGLLQQGQELRLQYEELKKSVEHSSKQAAAQQGHEKYMRQSVLNETRKIFEGDLASIALEAGGNARFSNKIANIISQSLGGADFNNITNSVVLFLQGQKCEGFVRYCINNHENREHAEMAKFTERRYLDCYEHGLECLAVLDGGDFYKTYYENSPFCSLYELFCEDLEANDKNTKPQNKEPS